MYECACQWQRISEWKRMYIEWNKVAVNVVTNVNIWQVEWSQLIVCLCLNNAHVCVWVCVLPLYVRALYMCMCAEQKLGARAQNRINIPLALAFLLSLILDLHTNTVYLFRFTASMRIFHRMYERTTNDQKLTNKKKKEDKIYSLNSQLSRIVMAQLHNCDLDEIWLF